MTTTSTTAATAAASTPAPQPDPEPLREPLREGPQAKPLDAETFRETLAFLTPKPEEMKWASIPWQTDLWEARRLAREQNKPIFMWSMNGKPLCQIPTETL